jgi:hypothetical protein
MNIKRTIVLVFALRTLMLGVGCGRAGDGDQCATYDGACNFLPDCQQGFYCNESGTCQPDTPPPVNGGECTANCEPHALPPEAEVDADENDFDAGDDDVDANDETNDAGSDVVDTDRDASDE